MSAEQIRQAHEKVKQLRKKYIQNGIIVVVTGVVLILVLRSIAWFSDNQVTTATGMSAETKATLFELRTTGSNGLFDDYIQRADAEYANNTETTAAARKVIWNLTAGNTDETVSQGNINNLYLDDETLDAARMREIKSIDSSEYGISPGDYGSLTFSIVPKIASVDVHLDVNFRLFKTSYDNDGYQQDVFTELNVNNFDDAEAKRLAEGHIVFFYKDSSNHMHLLSEDGFNEMSVAANRSVTLYWVWPENLRDITNENISSIDSTGKHELLIYMLQHPDKFLALDGGESEDIFDSIKLGDNPSASDVSDKVALMTATVSTTNYWDSKYNNADQLIGENVGYVMIEVIADLLHE